MQMLKTVCGLAVILTTVHLFPAAFHHFHVHAMRAGASSVSVWGGTALAVIVGAFSLAGGVLLVFRK